MGETSDQTQDLLALRQILLYLDRDKMFCVLTDRYWTLKFVPVCHDICVFNIPRVYLCSDWLWSNDSPIWVAAVRWELLHTPKPTSLSSEIIVQYFEKQTQKQKHQLLCHLMSSSIEIYLALLITDLICFIVWYTGISLFQMKGYRKLFCWILFISELVQQQSAKRELIYMQY